jgi:hypothetical protein
VIKIKSKKQKRREVRNKDRRQKKYQLRVGPVGVASQPPPEQEFIGSNPARGVLFLCLSVSIAPFVFVT